MKPQSYKNHVRYFTPHHFILLPLLLLAIGVSVYNIFHSPFQQMFYVWITIVLLFIFYVAIMLRQHYALGNQNRIVRLEMRLRYYQLTGERFDPLEHQLMFGQIAALRFASDSELPALVARAISENMPPSAIKKAIQQWQPDGMRV